jgi:hypothetical protein
MSTASHRALVAVAALTLALATATPVLGAEVVIGSPDVSAFSPNDDLPPGAEVSLPVYLLNEGNLRRGGPAEYVDRVTTARGVTFTVGPGSAPVDVDTGQYPVGSLPEGIAGPYDVSLTVAEDAAPGTYRLPVRVRYTYTLLIDYGSDPPEYVDDTDSGRHHLTIRVRDVARFRIVDTDSRVGVGGRGNVSVTVRNVGTDPARDASLQFEAPSADLRLGPDSTGARAFAGTWAPGETRTFEFAASASTDATVREYPLTGRLTYRDRDGIERTSRELTAGVTPLPEQRFAAENVSGSLHVGEPGTIRGTIRNAGPRTVHDAVLVYRPRTPSVAATDTEVALGRLAPGDRREFAFDVDVGERATPSAQQLNLTVRYRNAEGTRSVSDALEPTVRIAPERDWLSVRPVATTFGVDTDNRMTVEVRNVEDVPLRNVVARIGSTDPFTADSRVAYADRVAPGETATLAFAVAVSEDAVPARSTITMNVTAERPDGESVDAGTYDVPVTVVAESGPSDTAVLGVLALLAALVLGGGWWWLRR